MPYLKSPFLLLLLAFALRVSTASAATGVSASFDAPQVTLGEQAELTVRVSGSGASEPTMPTVDGLDIRFAGSGSEFQLGGGGVSATYTFTYLVTPKRAGTFTLPAIKVGDGQSQPITLTVLASGSASGGNSNPGTAAPPESTYGFILIQVPKKDFYVGELVPIDVKACINMGTQATLNALPSFEGEAFTLNTLSNKPNRSQEVVDGKPCVVLTWHSAITAVKAGDYSLKMQTPITVMVRERSPRRRRGDPLELFNDPFLNNPFFNQGRPQEVTLHSEPLAVKISPLPSQNRPPQFSGAIGNFDITATAKPNTVPVGDPINLQLTTPAARETLIVSLPRCCPTALDGKLIRPRASSNPLIAMAMKGPKPSSNW